MPSRIVREGINTSARINALSFMAELFYRRLMSVADDHGRFHASPATLRGSCWPTCPEKVTEDQISDWLRECCAGENPLLIMYETGGCKYVQFTNFGQHTRSKSKFPDPVDCAVLSACKANEKQMLSLDEDVFRSRSRISNAESYTESKSETNEQKNSSVPKPVRSSSGSGPFEIPRKPMDRPPIQPPRPPGNEILTAERQRLMRTHLLGYMSMHGTPQQRSVKPPDDGIILQCLQAVGTASMDDVGKFLRAKFVGLDRDGRASMPAQSPIHPNGPKSYAWFVPVLASHFQPQAAGARA